MPVDVSVVVPVYNTELYLNQCVDSLLAQTLKNVEFIFVDDGSTDRSLEILREYHQKDPRITILQQKNQFAGVARNNGMKVATGKYIIFVDSDDFFEPTMLEEAFNFAEENRAQIVVFDFYWFDNNAQLAKVKTLVGLPEGVFSANVVGEKLFKSVFAAPWNKLFLRDYVDKLDIHFQAVKKSNDTFFTLSSIGMANRIIHLNRALTYYRINNFTSLQGNQSYSFAAFVERMEAVKRELKTRESFVGSIRDAYNYYLCDLIHYFFDEAEKSKTRCGDFYNTVKTHLVPGLFDSASDFAEDSFIYQFYKSRSCEEFLCERIQHLHRQIIELNDSTALIHESYVSKKSLDYRIGHWVLALPRLILRIFRK